MTDRTEAIARLAEKYLGLPVRYTKYVPLAKEKRWQIYEGAWQLSAGWLNTGDNDLRLLEGLKEQRSISWELSHGKTYAVRLFAATPVIVVGDTRQDAVLEAIVKAEGE